MPLIMFICTPHCVYLVYIIGTLNICIVDRALFSIRVAQSRQIGLQYSVQGLQYTDDVPFVFSPAPVWLNRLASTSHLDSKVLILQ